MRYIQTWMYVSRLSKLPLIGNAFYRVAQWLCGKTTGHENSKTEWGYGGGEYSDVWCRWCNKIGRMPVKELDRVCPDSRTAIWNMTACDVRHKQWTPEG